MIDLTNSPVYDVETFPNAFTLHAELLHSDVSSTWEISHYRDDRQSLLKWFDYLYSNKIPMIGFNTLHFDYPVIHFIMSNPQCTVEQIYDKAMSIITGDDRFGHMIWERDRFAPQIDLFKIHHFDNKAKTTSLKALEINMRSETVVDMPVEVGTMLTLDQVNNLLIPYNKHDVKETKKFAHYSRKAIDFRIGLIDKIDGDVLNFNDTKIGEKLLEQRIGEDVCYDRSSGRKKLRQTVRYRIALADIIFPYIKFDNPEFARVLDWMKTQVLTPDDLDDPDAVVKTKGVFNGVKANVGGLDFFFGTGGIHASVPPQRVISGDGYIIRDIDVTGLYPSIAIVNNLSPEHLGEAFTREYKKLPEERAMYPKKSVESNSFKLAANGTYGKSNNVFSVFYDPQFTMSITINGQLMLCMLAEKLATVPTLQLIQANTDGITYRIHENFEPLAVEICKWWQEYTLLKLEDVNYSRMWIRDVNNYIAEDTKGKLKQKGAYWHPDANNYAESISEAGPPAWHKDLGNIVSIRAAIAYMVHGIDPELFIRLHTDPFDFMCRVKVNRGSKLMLGGKPIQNTTRYYIAVNGAPLVKTSPPTGIIGTYKKKNGISEREYADIMNANGGQWDERVCTKNKSKYENRETAIQAGWKIAECNNASDFDFSNVDIKWYVEEARKLII